MTDRSGETLAGTYRLVRRIGEGGMGSVYEAEHLRLPRRFAIKLLHAHAALDADMVQRFRREAEIASDLGNEHIVEVVDFNVTEDGSPYIVMELLRGESLASLLHREGALPLDDVVVILDQLASALHAAHERGIVHRDLKPQNVQVERRANGRLHAKILDFGISKILKSVSVVTGTGTVVGTPQYMAPEQALGKVDQVDARTDIFALGAILYEMLAGKPAFVGDSLPTILYQVVHEPPVPLDESASTIPEAVRRTVDHALAKKRDDRPATAADLRKEFLRAAGYEPGELASFPQTRMIPPADVPNAATAKHDPRRSRRGLFLALSLLGAAGVAIVVSVAVGGATSPATAAPHSSAPATTAPPPEPATSAPRTAAPATAAETTTAPASASAPTARPRSLGGERGKRPSRPLWETDL